MDRKKTRVETMNPNIRAVFHLFFIVEFVSFVGCVQRDSFHPATLHPMLTKRDVIEISMKNFLKLDSFKTVYKGYTLKGRTKDPWTAVVYYKAPNLCRIEIPAKKLISTFNGRYLATYDVEKKQAERFDAKDLIDLLDSMTMQYNSLFSIYKSLVGSDVPLRFDPLQIVPYPEVHASDKHLSVNLLLVISATPHPWALELQNAPEATLDEGDDDYVIRYPGRRITVAKSTGLVNQKTFFDDAGEIFGEARMEDLQVNLELSDDLFAMKDLTGVGTSDCPLPEEIREALLRQTEDRILFTLLGFEVKVWSEMPDEMKSEVVRIMVLTYGELFDKFYASKVEEAVNILDSKEGCRALQSSVDKAGFVDEKRKQLSNNGKSNDELVGAVIKDLVEGFTQNMSETFLQQIKDSLVADLSERIHGLLKQQYPDIGDDKKKEMVEIHTGPLLKLFKAKAQELLRPRLHEIIKKCIVIDE